MAFARGIGVCARPRWRRQHEPHPARADRRAFLHTQAGASLGREIPGHSAPEERVLVEAAFYRAVAGCPLVAERMPGFLGWDEENFVAAFEDLGETADCTDLYNDGEAAFASLPGLCQWLAALHQAAFDEPTRTRMENRAMRQLNHEHLYCFPLHPDNGLDLDAITLGLTGVAQALQGDAAYRSAIAELGALYLANGPCLLHGDFYPGSWVRAGESVWIIDPEFCFFGRRNSTWAFSSATCCSPVAPWNWRSRCLPTTVPTLRFPVAWRCNLPGWRSCGAHRRGSVAAGCGSVAQGSAVGDLAGLGTRSKL